MDKNFNDQELSEIMKEIDALEEEYSKAESLSSLVSEEADEADEVIEDNEEAEIQKDVPVSSHQEEHSAFLPFEKKKVSKQSSMTTPGHSPCSMMFKVQGELCIELQFEIGGKCVNLEVSQAGLSIEMDGGMTFSVPISGDHVVKKAV